MTLRTDLEQQVAKHANDAWPLAIPRATVVPTPESLTFSNSGKHLDACVLYADLRHSTQMVDALQDIHAAEYYKSFLHCAAKLIKDATGTITAYDGDRVMGIYTGTDKVSNALETAFTLNYAVRYIINPTFREQYGVLHRELQHTVGIDSGQLLVAKTGVRDDRDLVWVGPAANYAAKLNSFEGLDVAFPTRITERALNELPAGSFNRVRGLAPVFDGAYNNTGPRHYRSDLHLDIS